MINDSIFESFVHSISNSSEQNIKDDVISVFEKKWKKLAKLIQNKGSFDIKNDRIFIGQIGKIILEMQFEPRIYTTQLLQNIYNTPKYKEIFIEDETNELMNKLVKKYFDSGDIQKACWFQIKEIYYSFKDKEIYLICSIENLQYDNYGDEIPDLNDDWYIYKIKIRLKKTGYDQLKDFLIYMIEHKDF